MQNCLISKARRLRRMNGYEENSSRKEEVLGI